MPADGEPASRSRERFRRLEELFHQVENLAANERAELLAAVSEREPEIADELRRMVVRLEDGSDPSRLGQAVRARLDEAIAAGEPDRLGPYRLLRRIGEGGMGVVYEAQQEAPLHRRLAIKLVRRGLDSQLLLARLEAERETLARMAHPGIARIYDAGTAPDGRPYFVMELVDGRPITTFCDHERLPLAERILLFRQVLAAVQHAHQKGILHRDLKPTNILVSHQDSEPQVKVIDFGIAKLTDAPIEGEGLTRMGEVVGTPEYMSPEQARGGRSEVDTRSDVYSLGVVLYELLAGGLPIDRLALRGAGPAEVVRIVGDTTPSPPSSHVWPATEKGVAIASLRRSEPARLRRDLTGDLGRILMMALRKEPERRYPSVGEFAADLQRYLDGFPVMARPDSLSYRAVRLFHRHTLPVVAALTLVLGLAAATAVSTAMYFRAQAASRESEVQRLTTERMNEFLTGMLSSIDPDFAQGRDVSILRQVLDDAARRIETELEHLPTVAAELELTVGEAYASIGRLDEAEQRLRASLGRHKSTTEADPRVGARIALALGTVLGDKNTYEEAEALLRRAVDIRRNLEPPDGPGQAAALTALARLLEETGGYEEAERSYREALDLMRRQPVVDRAALASTLNGLGVYLMHQNRMDEAEAPLREAVEIRRSLPEAGRAGLVSPLISWARWFRWSERFDEAATLVEEAMAITRSDLPEEHPLRIEALANLANLRQQTGSFADAEALYRDALELSRRMHGDRHAGVGTLRNNLASLLHQLGRYGEAADLFAEAAATYRSVLGEDHYWVSIALFNAARSRLMDRRAATAEPLLVEARRIREAAQAAAWQMAEIDVLLAACAIERGELGGAEKTLREGIAALREHFGPDSDRDDLAIEALARVLESTDRRELAAAVRAGREI